jgi:hypothetical protein
MIINISKEKNMKNWKPQIKTEHFFYVGKKYAMIPTADGRRYYLLVTGNGMVIPIKKADVEDIYFAYEGVYRQGTMPEMNFDYFLDQMVKKLAFGN